jgi:hypothetical protein
MFLPGGVRKVEANFRWLLRGMSLAVTICLSYSTAVACQSPSSRMSIFHTKVPPTLDAPIVAEITIIKLIRSKAGVAGGYEDRFSFEGDARVERVVKGVIDETIIRVVAPYVTTCDDPFGIGSTGIVLGSMRRNDDGLLELRAISDFMFHNR